MKKYGSVTIKEMTSGKKTTKTKSKSKTAKKAGKVMTGSKSKTCK